MRRSLPCSVLSLLVTTSGLLAQTPSRPVPPAALARPPAPAVVRARVDSLVRAFVANGNAPGVSVQVVRGRDTLVRTGYGMADLEQQVPAGPGTVYLIGSITKQFTAAAVLRFVEAGKVRLDDSIGAYVSGLPAAWRGVTVRQLLNHTSGIPSYTALGDRWIRRWGEDMPPDTLVALTARDSMWFSPGTAWRYDNTGYVVLGMLIDRLAGQPYPEYVEAKLFRPLGLQHSYYCDVKRVIAGRARGYERVADGWRNATYLSMTQPYSAGALCSTVGDVARWNFLLHSGRVVGPESYRAMTMPEGAALASKYGFGLGIDTLAGHPSIRHGGGINGFNTDNAYFPRDALSVTVLTNSGSSRPTQLLTNVARAALGVPLELDIARVPLRAEERARYAGRYELQDPDVGKTMVDVIAGRAALMAQAVDQPAFELIPLGNHAFAASFDRAVRLTFELAGGRATGFTFRQGGATMKATRVGDVPATAP